MTYTLDDCYRALETVGSRPQWRKNNTEIRAVCPAHPATSDDGLQVTLFDDGGLHPTGHSGCSRAAILEVLGLQYQNGRGPNTQPAFPPTEIQHRERPKDKPPPSQARCRRAPSGGRRGSTPMPSARAAAGRRPAGTLASILRPARCARPSANSRPQATSGLRRASSTADRSIRLPQLADSDSATVRVVEGEKIRRCGLGRVARDRGDVLARWGEGLGSDDRRLRATLPS